MKRHIDVARSFGNAARLGETVSNPARKRGSVNNDLFCSSRWLNFENDARRSHCRPLRLVHLPSQRRHTLGSKGHVPEMDVLGSQRSDAIQEGFIRKVKSSKSLSSGSFPFTCVLRRCLMSCCSNQLQHRVLLKPDTGPQRIWPQGAMRRRARREYAGLRPPPISTPGS